MFFLASITASGISAGAICWFEEAVTDSVPGRISRVEGLGFLEGSACPHFDGQEERRPGFHRLLREGAIGDGVAADDGAALHFLGKELKQVVTSRPRAKAYRLQRRGDRVVERELESVYLGEKG